MPFDASLGLSCAGDVLGLSASTGDGLDMLLEVLQGRMADVVGNDSAEGMLITR